MQQHGSEEGVSGYNGHGMTAGCGGTEGWWRRISGQDGDVGRGSPRG